MENSSLDILLSLRQTASMSREVKLELVPPPKLWKTRNPCSFVHWSVWKKGRENKTGPSVILNLSCYQVAQEGKYSPQGLRPLGTLVSGTQAGAGTCPSAPALLPATAPCALA